MLNHHLIVKLIVLFSLSTKILGEKKINKDINEFNDVDIERLFEQWEENEDPLPPDELPEHLRPPPKLDVDLDQINNLSPEYLLKLSKKGKTVMIFVNLKDGIPKDEVNRLTGLWQTSLLNNHIVSERYPLDDNRAIYMFKDGSQSWDAKDFLIEQKEVDQVTVENKIYYGKYSDKKVETVEKTDEDSKDEL